MKITDLATPRMQAAIRGALEKWFSDGLDEEEIAFAWCTEGTFDVQISNVDGTAIRSLFGPKLGRSPKSTGAGAVAEILQEIRE